jgi:hypothetical protein
MRRVAIVVGLAVLLFGSVAMPASAKGKDEAPAQVCKALDNTWPPVDDRPFPFTIQSDGGCASSVAQGFPDSGILTGSAFISQCKFLEGLGISWPYEFYGDVPGFEPPFPYVAKNRADCKYFLSAFHYGELPTPSDS